MPFTDDGKFYHDRQLDHGDTYKMAAERLARAVETYLYAEDEPGYMRVEFLAWAISYYDSTKASSGNVVIPDFDADEMKDSPIPMGAGPNAVFDKSVRFDQNARDSKTVDTDPVEPADDGSPLPEDLHDDKPGSADNLPDGPPVGVPTEDDLPGAPVLGTGSSTRDLPSALGVEPKDDA